jgi:hypothetical protein
MGPFAVTTIQGKGQKDISFILAYIAVQKGSDMGVESLFAQQYTHRNKTIQLFLCLMNNQSYAECFKGTKVKPYSIE